MIAALRRLPPLPMALLLAAALLLRALLPVGWMPAAGADGALRTVLCSGAAEHPVVMELGEDGRWHPAKPDAPHDPCPYAVGGGQPLDLPPALALPTILPVATALLARAAADASIVSTRTAPPPARGPPARV